MIKSEIYEKDGGKFLRITFDGEAEKNLLAVSERLGITPEELVKNILGKELIKEEPDGEPSADSGGMGQDSDPAP